MEKLFPTVLMALDFCAAVPYDKNLVNYPKETKELLKLCKKACDRIAKEVA